ARYDRPAAPRATTRFWPGGPHAGGRSRPARAGPRRGRRTRHAPVPALLRASTPTASVPRFASRGGTRAPPRRRTRPAACRGADGRASCRALRLRGAEDLEHRIGVTGEIGGLGLEGAAAFDGQLVELRLAIVFGQAPLGLNLAACLEAVESHIERPV